MTDVEQTQGQAIPFKAEVKHVLQILAHSLYTDREIFLRELISNASDALYRVQLEQLTNQDVRDPEQELEIRISFDEEQKLLIISDTGIGMTREELIENLGTIAQSGARALLERLEEGQKSDIIGQFGVGFYSAFVVADEVTVVSQSYQQDAPAALWRSSGGESFEVGPAERETRGTTITLKLKEDAEEFLKSWRVQQAIKRHSDFVAFPIYVGENQANQRTALWRQAPRNVEAQQYVDFYRQLTLEMGEPLHKLHLSTESPIDIHAILFVPDQRERGLIERRVEGRIKLYSRKVLIQEDAQDLLPKHFRFIEGVVDSEDLPLNVSREGVQSSPVLEKIRRTLTNRLYKELKELAENDSEKYATFWREFGIFIKEGLATDPMSREELLPLLRFHSTASGEGLTALAAYKERMQAGQTEIYYVLAGDLESAQRSPHLEAAQERGLEVLLLVDVIDGFLINSLREFEGLKLRNLDDSSVELPGEAKEQAEGLSEERLSSLAERIKQALGEKVGNVRPTTVLRSSPARLVSATSGPEREMERLQRLLDRDYTPAPRDLELNGSHTLVAALAQLAEAGQDQLVTLIAEQLYDNALLLDGLHPNPAAMVARMQQLMEAAAASPAAPQHPLH